MKKILTLLAIFTLLNFAGCKPNFSDSGIDGGTQYTGDIVGAWELSENANGMNMYTEFTFYSDGGYCIYLEGSYQGQSKWTREKGLYYVDGDIIAISPVKYEASETLDQEDIEEQLYRYRYLNILDVTPKTLEVALMLLDTSELDFEKARTYVDNEEYSEHRVLTKK